MNPDTSMAPAPPYSLLVEPVQLRHAMRIRGLTGAELARRAGVSQATISHALNGHRIHPATLRAIDSALRSMPPVDDAAALVAREDAEPRDRPAVWNASA